MSAELEEAKFLSKELQTVCQSAKASLESSFNAHSLSKGMEESDVAAALSYLTDVYLTDWHLALRFVPSQSASGPACHHLSGSCLLYTSV